MYSIFFFLYMFYSDFFIYKEQYSISTQYMSKYTIILGVCIPFSYNFKISQTPTTYLQRIRGTHALMLHIIQLPPHLCWRTKNNTNFAREFAQHGLDCIFALLRRLRKRLRKKKKQIGINTT
jgi:hypothetical protein